MKEINKYILNEAASKADVVPMPVSEKQKKTAEEMEMNKMKFNSIQDKQLAHSARSAAYRGAQFHSQHFLILFHSLNAAQHPKQTRV